MDPFQALAFDPGGSTGWAWFEYRDSLHYSFSSGTIADNDHHYQIRELISQCTYWPMRPLTVITESFEFRQNPDSAKQRRGLELVSREYIGVMKLVCQDLCIPLIQQSPGNIQHGSANSSGFMNYSKLERIGQLHKPLTGNEHRHDALQHLVYWLAAKKRVEEIILALKRDNNT